MDRGSEAGHRRQDARDVGAKVKEARTTVRHEAILHGISLRLDQSAEGKFVTGLILILDALLLARGSSMSSGDSTEHMGTCPLPS